MAQPMANALLIEVHAILIVLGQERIVSAEPFDIASVTRGAGIGHNDAVIRAFLRAAPG